jgi:hypothetical protein
MKKVLFGVAVLALTFLAGSFTVTGKQQTDQNITAKASCTVPKSYGDFKGMSGAVFIFENPANGTLKTLTCTSQGWEPQIQITRSN